jgi:epoxyqueuosine reductase
MNMVNLTTQLKQKALDLGFQLVGVTPAQPSAFAEEYRSWLDKGYAGEMGYLHRNLERRLDPRELVPGAKSIIVVGMNYYTRTPESDIPEGERAIFARYARGDDYHDVITERLKQLLAWLQQQVPGAQGRVYVDAGPVLEREVAQRAGLGWFGKNTMLINTRRGSYFFLGEIVTDVLLEPDSPAIGGCGSCRRCLDACPTGAFPAPYVLDATRCISYLTIENKGPIPEEFVPAIAATGRIYGCDICQEVCPFNADRGDTTYTTYTPYTASTDGAEESTEYKSYRAYMSYSALHGASPNLEPAFQPRPITINSTVEDILLLSEEDFRTAFKGSPVKRAKWAGLKRNAAAATTAEVNDLRLVERLR